MKQKGPALAKRALQNEAQCLEPRPRRSWYLAPAIRLRDGATDSRLRQHEMEVMLVPWHEILQAAVSATATRMVRAGHAGPLGDKPGNGALIKATGGELERSGGAA